MEAEVITKFLPRLKLAISDTVQPVSDHCLAKGLIPESVYKRVLESGGTSEDKARTLILAVKKSTETDRRCLEILLSILEEQLPFAAREKLLSEIREELTEKPNTCTEVVLSTQTVQPSQELPRESDVLHELLLAGFEDAIRQHERACAEKNMLKEKLKVKSEEYERLKDELEAMKCRTESITSIQSSVANTQSRIVDCEEEIKTLKERVTTLEDNIEEQGMKVKRGKSTTALNARKMLVAFAQRTLTTTFKKVQGEMRTKERELSLIIQEKDLKIKELELKSEQQKKSTQPLDEIPSDIIRTGHIELLHKSMQESDQGLESWWKCIASRVGFTTEEIQKIENEKQSGRQLLGVLNEWVQWYPGDRRGSTNFPTYTALITAIKNIGIGAAVKHLIPYNELYSSKRRNY